MRPTKIQTSLCIRAVWSEVLMGAIWIVKGPSFLRRKTKTLIRLCGCAGWSEFSLYVHSNFWYLTRTGSFVSLTHPFEQCKMLSWFAHLSLFISWLRVIWESNDPGLSLRSSLLHPGSWILVDTHVHVKIPLLNAYECLSCHIYFTRYEHFPAGFWHTFITQNVNTTERLVGVLAVCSGGQRPLNISRVPFHELFHGANSGTCSHTGKTGSERQTEPTKSVWFSHILIVMQVLIVLIMNWNITLQFKENCSH